MENESVEMNPVQEQQGDAVVGSANLGETQAEKVEETSADNSQSADGQEKNPFGRALEKRVAEEKRKWEREAEERYSQRYAADSALAGTLRRLHQGKDDKAIEEALFDAQARQLADEEHISESFAKRLLRAEMSANNYAAVPQTTKTDNDERITMLNGQIQEIKENDGVDMLEVLKSDDFIKDKVGSGEWDINRAYSHYLSSKRKSAPPVNRGGARSESTKDWKTMSSEEFAKYRERLRQGQTLRP